MFFFDKGLLAMGNVSVMTNFMLMIFYLSANCVALLNNIFCYSCLSNQILFVSGVSLTIGLKSTMQFFMKRSNFKVNFVICFFLHSMSLHGSFSTLTFYIFTGSVGNHFIRYWIHYSYLGVAYSGHDCGVLWIHRTLQV